LHFYGEATFSPFGIRPVWPTNLGTHNPAAASRRTLLRLLKQKGPWRGANERHSRTWDDWAGRFACRAATRRAL